MNILTIYNITIQYLIGVLNDSHMIGPYLRYCAVSCAAHHCQTDQIEKGLWVMTLVLVV